MHQPVAAVDGALERVLFQRPHEGVVQLQLGDTAIVQVDRLLQPQGENHLALYVHFRAIQLRLEYQVLVAGAALGRRAHPQGQVGALAVQAQRRNGQVALALGVMSSSNSCCWKTGR